MKPIMSFDEFLTFRNVKIRNKDHERVVQMFYPHLTSVCGVPEALLKVIGKIIGVNFSDTTIITGCFNGNLDGVAAPYGIPDLYCKWDNGVQVYVYGALPECELIVLKDNEYVLFALSDVLTDNIERTADRYTYIKRNALMNNIDDIVKSDLCIGCGACFSLCPFGTLETTIGDFGYPVPLKSPDCNDCGICLLECPSADRNEEDDDG